MKPQFDLIDEPWIPCVGLDGSYGELGLRETLVRAHQLRELAGESPLITAALYRLLLAVLHRVVGPASYDAWGNLWNAGQWNASSVSDYLDRWHSRFNLFDSARPFYQAADPRVKPKTIASLVHDVASGNNATLFDHHTDGAGMALTPAQAARVLVAAQTFGLAGLSGLVEKFTDGPWARGVIFLVQGDTLFETLALNLLRYPGGWGGKDDQDDRPAWEMDDPFIPQRAVPLGYLDYLTWHNRRILLLPEDTAEGIWVRQSTVAPGLRLAPEVLDPMKHYRRDKERGPIALRFNEERALWRDSASLFQLDSADWRPPLVFGWAAELADEGYLEPAQTRRTLALGMANDQARVDFYRSERFPLPLRYLQEPALVERLTEALAMAEEAGRQLWGAARSLATYLLSPDADAPDARKPLREDLDQVMAPWGVERLYWSRLETPFRRVLETLPDDRETALAEWRQILIRTARDAFEAAADAVGVDARALKAVVRARGQFNAGLLKALSVK